MREWRGGWSRKQVVDGVYRLDEGALLDDCFHVLQELGVVDVLERVRGKAIQRAMVPFVQYLLLDGLKTLFGVESMHALPAWLLSDEALMRLVGFNATQVREGVCRRSHEKRQGAKAPGPICPDTLAKTSVKLHVRDLEALCNGVIRALAQAGVFRAQVTGIVDGTDLETTAQKAVAKSLANGRSPTRTAQGARLRAPSTVGSCWS
jgi:hypothetical protein